MVTRSTPVRTAWRSLTGLTVIVAALVAVLTGAVLWSDAEWAPKLGLDLEGGTQIVLAPSVADGETVSQEQLDQAVAIIRQRVDASGVAEAAISTSGTNIVVDIPGEPDQATLDRIQASAKLEFRAVLLADLASNVTADTPTPEAADPAADGTTDGEGDVSAGDAAQATPGPTPTDASDLAWVTEELQAEFDSFDCTTLESAGTNVAPADEPLVTCSDDGSVKYLLGIVEVSGDMIADASAGLRQTSQGALTNEWAVNIDFTDAGQDAFGDVTTRLFGLSGVRNQFAIVLDGRVISAPTTNAAITDGRAEISGSFTQESAETLANQLKYGALPIGFTVQSRDTISATLGASQLQSGLIAGLVGLILVVIYSFFQYRLLASVTIASLVVAGGLTYLVIAIMGWRYDYRLTLAGVAGLIVAIGFTVDSFIVYFERIRDELRDGRSLVGAVEAGWTRALRTILAAKGVNLLSAAILFLVAVGNVQGFALTLGITVIIDVLVVLLFTHPMLQLLATTRFFSSGHPLSGLDPTALGAVYRGRAQFRTSVEARRSGASREAGKRQTIAERKAAELAGDGGSAAKGRTPMDRTPADRTPTDRKGAR